MAERIRVESLVKIYPGGNRALDDLSIEVDEGTFLVLLGPSGSGKTTLLRSIAGIDRISAGSISIGDTVVADRSTHLPPERRDLAMVFQDYALWPHMVARDNVAFALKRRGLDRRESQRLAIDMLERVGLGALAERYPTELSGGEQQRVALARALVGDTGLILCDEPLSNLDADLRERMRVEISALVRAAGATTVYITHDQAEAFALADRIGVLQDGRLVQEGVPEEIYARPSTPFVARFTGLAGELRGRACGGGDELVDVDIDERGAMLPIRCRAATPDGGEGSVLIRPTAARMCDADDGAAHARGVVADVAFRGRGYEHAVRLESGVQFTGIFADHRVERRAAVGLVFDAAGCHFFPDAPFFGDATFVAEPQRGPATNGNATSQVL